MDVLPELIERIERLEKQVEQLSGKDVKSTSPDLDTLAESASKKDVFSKDIKSTKA